MIHIDSKRLTFVLVTIKLTEILSSFSIFNSEPSTLDSETQNDSPFHQEPFFNTFCQSETPTSRKFHAIQYLIGKNNFE